MREAACIAKCCLSAEKDSVTRTARRSSSANARAELYSSAYLSTSASDSCGASENSLSFAGNRGMSRVRRQVRVFDSFSGLCSNQRTSRARSRSSLSPIALALQPLWSLVSSCTACRGIGPSLSALLLSYCFAGGLAPVARRLLQFGFVLFAEPAH